MIDQREPTLKELLNEPIIRQVMKRDGVRAEDIHRLMEAARARTSGERQVAVASQIMRRQPPSLYAV